MYFCWLRCVSVVVPGLDGSQSAGDNCHHQPVSLCSWVSSPSLGPCFCSSTPWLPCVSPARTSIRRGRNHRKSCCRWDVYPSWICLGCYRKLLPHFFPSSFPLQQNQKYPLWWAPVTLHNSWDHWMMRRPCRSWGAWGRSWKFCTNKLRVGIVKAPSGSKWASS